MKLTIKATSPRRLRRALGSVLSRYMMYLLGAFLTVLFVCAVTGVFRR